MPLREEILSALAAGNDHRSVLALVRRHQDQGMTREASYEVLEGVWRQFGFDDCDQASPTRDTLEYVLEKVWFQAPVARGPA